MLTLPLGGPNGRWVAAGSVTTMSKKPGATTAPLGMNGICRFTTPTFSSGMPSAAKRSTTSNTTSGLLLTDSCQSLPLPCSATAWAITFMPCSSMSRATKV